jgi:hypothetical protein
MQTLPRSAIRFATQFCRTNSRNFLRYLSPTCEQMEKSGKIKINQEEMKTLTGSAGAEGM